MPHLDNTVEMLYFDASLDKSLGDNCDTSDVLAVTSSMHWIEKFATLAIVDL